jgi:hypothetical protein
MLKAFSPLGKRPKVVLSSQYILANKAIFIELFVHFEDGKTSRRMAKTLHKLDDLCSVLSRI